MADELKPLVVRLEASLTKYNNAMASVAKTAATAAATVDKSFKQANDNVAKSFQKSQNTVVTSLGAQRNAVQNLSFQLNDLATGLASGTSPFTLMVQQGSQVVQSLEEGGKGFKNVFGTIGGAITQVVNPLSIVTFGVIGLTAAAIEFFGKWLSGSNETQKGLQDHATALKTLSDEYKGYIGDLEKAAAAQQNLATQKGIPDQVKAIRSTQQGFDVNSLNELQAALGKLQGNFAGGATRGALDADQDALTGLQKEAKAGTLTIAELSAALEVLDGTLETLNPKMDLHGTKEGVAAAEAALRKVIGVSEQVGAGLAKIGDQPDPAKLEAYEKAMKAMQGLVDTSLTKAQQAWKDYQTAIDAATDAVHKHAAEVQYASSLTALNAASVQALGTTSAGGDFSKLVAQIESGGKNLGLHQPGTGSTVSGLYGFTDSTFVAAVKELKEYADASTKQILANKSSPELQDKAFAQLTADDAAKLTAAGQQVNDATLYLAHLAGVGGAINLLNNPKSTFGQVEGPAAAKANPSFANLNVDQLLAVIQKKLDSAAKQLNLGQGFKSDFAGKIEDYQGQTEKINAEQKALGNLGSIIDQVTQEREKAKAVQDLEQAATKQGIDLTDEQKQQIESVASAYANAQGSVAGYKNAIKDSDAQARISVQSQKELAEQAARTRDQFASIASNFVSGFISDLKSGKSATEALTDALSRLADQLLDMALNSLFKQLFSGLFPGATTLGGGGGGGLASLFGFHTGGKIGGNGGTPHAPVSPSVFVGAPRFHVGGQVGLAPGEVPIIAQAGEVVIPKSQVGKMNAQAASRTTSVSNVKVGDINIDMSSTGVTASSDRQGAAFGDQVRKAVQQVIVRESRPGGLLTTTGSQGRVGR